MYPRFMIQKASNNGSDTVLYLSLESVHVQQSVQFQVHYIKVSEFNFAVSISVIWQTCEN